MIKAMKQALEALEEIVKWYGVRDKNDVMMPPLNQNPEIKESMDAITALRTAIEQAERQETNQVTLTQTNIGIGERGMEAYEAAKERGWVGVSDERLMEMPKQEQGEPVACIHRNSKLTLEIKSAYEKGFEHGFESAKKREWIGLTEEDKQIAFDDTQEGGGFWEFADAIEAKLRSKNT